VPGLITVEGGHREIVFWSVCNVSGELVRDEGTFIGPLGTLTHDVRSCLPLIFLAFINVNSWAAQLLTRDLIR
jgi:hypothetical protein